MGLNAAPDFSAFTPIPMDFPSRSRLTLSLLLVWSSLLSTSQARAQIVPEKETLPVSGYLLNNNVWGKDNSPTGWQKVEVVRAGTKLSWAVSYDWPVGSSPYAVKCYPSVVTGWQWGVWSSDGRLPKTVSALKKVVSGATAKVTNPGVQNVAYDLWFHAAGSIAEQKKPTDELMIWTNRFGGAGPLGKPVAKMECNGEKWELWTGDVGWKVFSFVRQDNTGTWTLDVKVFIDYLIQNGLMPADRQLTGLQFGTEVFRSPGPGRLDVTDYFVEIE